MEGFEHLRSHRWFGPDDLRSFGHRSRLKGMGFADEDYLGKPVIGILNTWSDLNTCHSHLRERAEEVKRGVWQAGGFPVEVPVMSLGEMLMKPTTMLYRNLLSMETEETIRCHPLDGVVLMGGCDKTTPALLMGAISANLPTARARCTTRHRIRNRRTAQCQVSRRRESLRMVDRSPVRSARGPQERSVLPASQVGRR